MNTLPDSHPTLGSLQRFLANFELSVVAHSREELTAEQKSTIRCFADGKLEDSERKALVPLLSSNTTALEYLADLLKRPDSRSAGK